MKSYIIYFLFSICLGSLQAQLAETLNERSKEFLAKEKYEKAWPLLKKAATMGHPEAQYNLGLAYETGKFIRKSLASSAEWYSKSAQQGYPDAVYKMMLAYGSGIGVYKNPELAFQYAQQCADEGYIECMNYLLGCYQEGWATDKDPAKMVDWAITLGKQDNPVDYKQSVFITDARLNLARWYREGEYVEEDFYKSYIWFLLFNESKKDVSFFKQRNIIKEIKQMEKVLDAGELLQAKVDAEEMLGRPLRNVDRLYDAEF